MKSGVRRASDQEFVWELFQCNEDVARARERGVGTESIGTKNTCTNYFRHFIAFVFGVPFLLLFLASASFLVQGGCIRGSGGGVGVGSIELVVRQRFGFGFCFSGFLFPLG